MLPRLEPLRRGRRAPGSHLRPRAGLTNAELAARLYPSTRTVDRHVSAILGKLQVANRRDAVRRARESGIVGVPLMEPEPPRERVLRVGSYPT
ncbi:MAG: helix-turn-helix transcriptional regulator [Mycobacterium sp.]